MNEDAVATPDDIPVDRLHRRGYLCIVSDGIGSLPDGDVASRLVVRTMMEVYYGAGPADLTFSSAEAAAPALARTVQQAHAMLQQHAEAPSGETIGATVVAAVLIGHDIAVAHVGDSRAYIVSRERCQALTRDQRLVDELVARGALSSEEAEQHPHRKGLSQALGVNASLTVLPTTCTLRPGDRVVLTSDGLWDVLTEAGLSKLLAGRRTPLTAIDRVRSAATLRPYPDDLSVVVLDPFGGGMAHQHRLPVPWRTDVRRHDRRETARAVSTTAHY